MESLSAVSYASTGTCGCWSGTCKPAEVLIFMCFSLPKLCSIFAAGRCNTIVFYSSTSHPPRNSSAAIWFHAWISSKARGRSSQRSCTVCFLIYVYQIDISRLKSGIRRTPHLFWKPKKPRGGPVYFMWSGEIFLRSLLPCPAKYSRVKGGMVSKTKSSITTWTLASQRPQRVTSASLRSQAKPQPDLSSHSSIV